MVLGGTSQIHRWVREYRQKAVKDGERAKALADMEKLYKLQKENEELRKEIDFLKKAAAFFAKESR